MHHLADMVGVDIDGARYCLECAPDVIAPGMADATTPIATAEAAQEQGIGGPVFAGQLEDIEHCDNCGDLLIDE